MGSWRTRIGREISGREMFRAGIAVGQRRRQRRRDFTGRAELGGFVMVFVGEAGCRSGGAVTDSRQTSERGGCFFAGKSSERTAIATGYGTNGRAGKAVWSAGDISVVFRAVVSSGAGSVGGSSGVVGGGRGGGRWRLRNRNRSRNSGRGQRRRSRGIGRGTRGVNRRSNSRLRRRERSSRRGKGGGRVG